MLYFYSKPQNNVFLSQHLYKSMEELDEKKADKELVEMEIEIVSLSPQHGIVYLSLSVLYSTQVNPHKFSC